MKKLKILATLALSLILLFGATSCVVSSRPNNGKHIGGFKN